MKNDVEMGFAAEDNVFAKVKGFPPWPAKIKNIIHQDNNTYYNVEFYGTHEWAKLKFSDLYLYNDNKAELGKPKTRNPKFNKALQEIEQSISEYSNEISINIENDCAVNESVSVNNRLERRVAEHASQIEELESKCTHIEKALKKEKSLRLEELELSVCMEADVEMDVQKHKDTIKTLTQDLSIYIEDAKIKNKVIEELNANTTFLNNELNQLNQENSLLNSRISQLKLNIENEKLKFTSQVNDFKSLENTLKLQIAQFEQHQSNLNIKNLDGKDGIVNARENNLNLCTTLLANEWIQDDVISLYFDFLLRSIVMEDVYFMNPCISQAIKCAESIDGLLEQEMISKAYVFIPINDSEGAMDVSGSHWSLMLYAKTEKTFYYFDSMKNYNLNHAKDIFTKMESHMCSSGPCCFIEVKCPQQRDGIECGVYMLFFVDWLIKIIWAQEDNGTFDFKGCFDSFEINESDIIQKRSIVTYLTYNLQYKKLREDIAKELIFCILNGKGDLKTNQSQVNIYEPHVIAKERAPASENTTLQYDNEETCSATSNNQEWSLVKGKHRLKYFNHQHSRKECKALSGVDTANRYDVLDGHSEIYEKENRLPINNLSANNLTKKISTDKSYSG
ncbi:SUMO1 sentrin specific peptidase 8 [Homalodisca vitripennis]|nr:SUMO1 sentrin specific peptidase 8 [Homalodisca vitripennis]